MAMGVDVLPDVAERAGWLGWGGSALGRSKKCEASRVQLACAWRTKVARVTSILGFIGNELCQDGIRVVETGGLVLNRGISSSRALPLPSSCYV
jgi:hypothetical protein